MKDVSRESRNKILMIQKVLSGGTFDLKKYEKLIMIKLIEYVRYQGWMNLFEESTAIVFKNEVR